MTDLREVTDQFKCPICWQLFENPTAIPCGHNFCHECISVHWDRNQTCNCPVCKEVFSSRPELRVNKLISAMVKAFQQRRSGENPNTVMSEVNEDKVNCDICSDHQAVKTCLVCALSYCDTHLQPHLQLPELRMHKLIVPNENPSAHKCPKHNKLFELFCQTDQTCVCSKCFLTDHHLHEAVPMRTEYEGKKMEATSLCRELQKLITNRHLVKDYIKQEKRLNDEEAKTEKDAGMEFLTTVETFFSNSKDEFINTIKRIHSDTDRQLQGFIDELEQELSDLEERKSELEHLSTANDPPLLLNRFQNLNTNRPSKDWSQLSFLMPTYSGTASRMIASLEGKIVLRAKQISNSQLKYLQKAMVNITLDPETAHPWLLISDNMKQVSWAPTAQKVSDNPNRFTYYASVLAHQSFSSGQVYFEVSVKEKTKWDVGVVRASIDRKRESALNPKNGYWVISMRRGKEYRAVDDPPIRLSVDSAVQKLGIFVDYDSGVVSFYNVETCTLIHTFSGCSFAGRLYPFFNPCQTNNNNTAPITIITSANSS